MNKNITAGIDAIRATSLTKVKQQIESGDMVPSTFRSLTGPKQMYVKLVTFERRSPEEACRILARKLTAAGSPVPITPEELRTEYMLDRDIKRAIKEIVHIRDDEYSLSIQSAGRMAQGILQNLMVNSGDEEIQLKAASKVADLAAKDYQDKRGKMKIDVSQTTREERVVWDIRTTDEKSMVLPSQNVIDATVVTKEPGKLVKKATKTEEEIVFDLGNQEDYTGEKENEEEELY